MGLWEFLQQWQGRRTTVGIALSLALHGLLVASALWGLAPGLEPRWKPKPGDSLIIELPKPDEPAAAGSRSAASAPPPSPPARVEPAPPPSPPARVEPRPATPPAPRREAPTPAPREERRVAAAPRPSAPAPPAPRAPEVPVPRAPETPTSVPEPAPPAREASPAASEPAPPAAEPTPRVAEPTPRVAEPGPRTPATDEARGAGSDRQVASLPPGGPARPSASDVRAALRAGAGGRGQGRGGIEGDPIPLDSPDGRYSDYLEQVKRKITEKWGYPCVKNTRTRDCEAITTSLDVQFGILKDGRIQYVEIVRVSDNAIYDEYAVNAILLAQPYPPVPPVMMQAMKAGSTGIPIRARFSYVVESSLTKFLR